RSRALDGLVPEAVRAAADDPDRTRDRGSRAPDVPADLRAGGKHTVNRPLDRSVLPVLAPELVASARADAARSQRRVIAILEERLGLPANDYLACLGVSLHYRTATMEELDQLDPAFDVVSFEEAARRECIPFRDTDG